MHFLKWFWNALHTHTKKKKMMKAAESTFSIPEKILKKHETIYDVWLEKTYCKLFYKLSFKMKTLSFSLYFNL